MSVDRATMTSRNSQLAGILPTAEVLSAGDLSLPVYFRWKGLVDRLLAAILLIPGLPVIGLTVLLVRLTSRGRGIYRQTRLGKDGQVFSVYKIRTMKHNAEARTGPVWTQVNDPRITPIGRVLRRLHLDEFPQLFNVLRGEMSLIGPRPERPEFVDVLAEAIPGYESRLVVPPGITGLAQVNLDPDTDLNSVRRKLTLDLEYIQHAGPLLDVRIFLCTLAHLLWIRGDRVKRLLKVHRPVSSLNSVSSAAAELQRKPGDLGGDGRQTVSHKPGGDGAAPPRAQGAKPR